MMGASMADGNAKANVRAGRERLGAGNEGLDVALSKSMLFEGVSPKNRQRLLDKLGASVRSHRKDTLLIRLGDTVARMGVVVSGTVEVGFYDETGELATVNRLDAGGMIGESIAYAGEPSIVQATAVDECRVLWMDTAKLLSPGVLSGDDDASRVVANLVRIISRKNVFLNQKAQILTQRFVRDRIKLYLKDNVDAKGVAHIASSRGDLARFLGVNRSALSREMGRLRDEGILRSEGEAIVVLDKNFLSY